MESDQSEDAKDQFFLIRKYRNFTSENAILNLSPITIFVVFKPYLDSALTRGQMSKGYAQ